jgi:hypothetical protein
VRKGLPKELIVVNPRISFISQYCPNAWQQRVNAQVNDKMLFTPV